MSRGMRIAFAGLATLAALVAGGPSGASGASGSSTSGQAYLPSIGDPLLAAPVAGRPTVLIPARYPLRMSGHKAKIRLQIVLPGRKTVVRLNDLVHASGLRLADRRRSFRFIHALELPARLSSSLGLLRRKARVSIGFSTSATGVGGFASGSSKQGIDRAPARLCSSVPLLLLKAAGGLVAKADLPRCGSRFSWKVTSQPDSGRASVTGAGLRFVQDPGQSGADSIGLSGSGRGGIGSNRNVQLRISPTAASTISIRALGDSVTAGFGYFGKTGKQMSILSLPDCEPGATVYNDACSSNSSNLTSKGSDPNYLPDFGLSRNISWAAQWANQYGVTDYRNYAVSGSAPADWLPGGQFDKARQQIEQQNPDYIVMTLGANPLLSDMLFGVDEMGCAIESDLFGGYKDCIEAAFASVNLGGNLNQLYTQLIDNTTSRILVMQYHLSIPSSGIAYSAAQIELMGELLNDIVAFEANSVSPERINVITPPRFDVGIDMTPLYPAEFSCSFFDWKVDGPSVQAAPSQDFLEALHPLSFCSGPAIGAPWVISGDTGIHPSAVGYSRMAGQIPPPE